MSLKMPEVTSRNWIRISVFCSFRAVEDVSTPSPGRAAIENRIHTFTGLHDEGNAIPSLVLDVRNHGAESRAARVLRDSIILLVGGLATVERLSVLADDDVLWLNGVHRAQNTHLSLTLVAAGGIRDRQKYLLITNVFSRERDGTLHGKKRQHLQKV